MKCLSKLEAERGALGDELVGVYTTFIDRKDQVKVCMYKEL